MFPPGVLTSVLGHVQASLKFLANKDGGVDLRSPGVFRKTVSRRPRDGNVLSLKRVDGLLHVVERGPVYPRTPPRTSVGRIKHGVVDSINLSKSGVLFAKYGPNARGQG